MGAQTPKGKLVANLLYQSWRPSVRPRQISEGELSSITTLLLGSGAGALAWNCIRNSPLSDSPSAIDLQQAFRLHALNASVFEDDIKKVLTLLRSDNVDPVLIKGWAIARLYPDTALRPYGDIDFCVRQSEYCAAEKACKIPESQRYVVDLHARFHKVYGLSIEEVFDRAQVVKLGNAEVRVPGAEDHLRILSLHMLRHGAWRPLWLCDLAVALETRPSDFDWGLCLGRNRQRADWIACSIGLAHQLLGADVDGTPVAQRANRLPGWLVSNVLKQWETPFSTAQPPMNHDAPMVDYVRHPRGLFADLLRRWPNPIEATVYVGGSFNQLPRFPFQIGECIARTAKFVAALPKALRETQGKRPSIPNGQDT